MFCKRILTQMLGVGGVRKTNSGMSMADKTDDEEEIRKGGGNEMKA